MILLKGLSKTYRKRGGEVKALDHLDLEVEEGEFVVIQGPSGSGKTTLLLTAGGMLSPTEGEVSLWGEDLYAMSPGHRAKFRARNIGFVFQMYYLVPYLNTLENVRLASSGGRAPEALSLLERLGLSERIHHKPFELSAGERQRTAVARALLNRPRLILADEPTGNLDPECAGEVLSHLAAFKKEGGTVLLVTHGVEAADLADRILRLRDGRIEPLSPDPAC